MLARVLSPADFGLIAIAMILVSVVDIVLEVPVTQALTRLSEVRKSHLDTAFTLGILRSLLLAFVVLASAWPFSALYQDNRLTLVVAALAIGPISRGLYSPGMVSFIRDISFWQTFVTDLAGKTCAASLAIALLYLGGGYWSIVVNSVAASAVGTIVSYVLAPYRPALSLAHLPELSKFIGWFSVAQFIAALNWQFDRVLLGHFVSRSSLGLYTIASNLAFLPVQSLTGPTTQPVLAALSKLTSQRERLQNAYLKASRFTMMLAVPVCVGMSLTSDLIIDVLFDAKWSASSIYLQWLALTIVLATYFQPLQSLALALNKPDIIFRLNVIELAGRIVLVSLGIYIAEIIGVIAAQGILSLLMFFVLLVTARSLIGVSAKSQLENLWKVAAACTVMVVAVLVIRSYLSGDSINVLLELVSVSVVGSMVYVTMLYALGVRLVPTRNW
jgi:PST family polysaccharide transporter